MIEIDGGKGGGQMLRTALTLSVVTGKNFRIHDIRGNRNNPGLKKQHFEAVKSAERLCDAHTQGVKQGSDEVVFKPGKYRNESFTANIGTAGSTTLLLDTILPITTQFDEQFRINVKGGTDVKWSPTSLYYKRVKLHLLKESGLEAKFDVEKTGFYPKGGGELKLTTQDSSMESFKLLKRGELQKLKVYSKASRDLKSQKVAERQAKEAEKLLKKEFISKEVSKEIEYVESASTGSVLLIKAVYEDSVAGFDIIGEKGKRSEEVAEDAFQDFMEFHRTEAVVDEHMADQLMVFSAIVGGEYYVPEITPHTESNLNVIKSFDIDIIVERKDSKALISNKS